MSLSNTAKGVGVAGATTTLVVTGVVLGTNKGTNSESSVDNQQANGTNLNLVRELTEDEKEFQTIASTRQETLVEPFRQLLIDLNNSPNSNSLIRVCSDLKNKDYDSFTSELASQTKEYCKITQTLGTTLGNFLLPFDNEDEVWKKLQIKLHTSQKTDLVNPFKSLKDSFPVESQTNGNLIKAKCQDLFNFSDFGSDKQSKLKGQMKEFCSITIKEMLGDKTINFNETSGVDQIKERVKELKAYVKSGSKKADVAQNKPLSAIKKEYTDASKDEGWQDLKVWCSNTYASFYQGSETNLWLLVNEFCVTKNN